LKIGIFCGEITVFSFPCYFLNSGV
jgi:hypothetical protein